MPYRPLPVKIAVIFLISLFFMSKLFAKEVRLEIEWDEVEGAKHYELHVFSESKKLLQKKVSENHIFETFLNPGRYLLRARVSDERQVWGDWSDWTEFKVLATLPPPAFINKNIFASCKDWKGQTGNIVANLSYRNYLGTKWTRIFSGSSSELKKMLIEKTPPPGYLLFEIRATSPGWKDSPVIKQECQRKPTLKEVEA